MRSFRRCSLLMVESTQVGYVEKVIFGFRWWGCHFFCLFFSFFSGSVVPSVIESLLSLWSFGPSGLSSGLLP